MSEPLLKPSAPIGIFDSGLGGLTVLRAITIDLPGEELLYLGDTARVPYGTRSASTVVRYARTCGTMLAARGIKLLVVACNTVSAVALDMLRVELDIPVLGVIEPGARLAATSSQRGRIGVLATAGTVASHAYPRAVAAFDSKAEVRQQAAPLLVPLAEEGWLDGSVPELVVERYLRELWAQDPEIDTVVLGCTHYPLLANVVQEVAARVFSRPMNIIDSGRAAAVELSRILEARQLHRPTPLSGRIELLVTDRPAQFGRVASRFLGRDAEALPITQVDL